MPTVSGPIERALARLMPPDRTQRADAMAFLEGRAYVFTAVVFLVTDVTVGLLLGLTGTVGRVGNALAACTAVLLAGLLIAFRQGLSLEWSARLLTAVAVTAFLGAITVTGGLDSPLAPWVPALPLGVLVTQNHRRAWMAFAGTALAVAAWLVAAQAGLYGPLPAARFQHWVAVAGQGQLAIVVLLVVSTAKRRSRSELARRRAEAEAARTLAEAESRAKTHMMASVSHEVRTPMTGILGLAELLSDSPLDDRQATWVRTIRGTGEALLTIVDDLLDATRLDAGAMPLADEPFHMARLLEQVAALFAPTASAKSITLHVTVHADVPDRLRGDPARLRQILVNLIGNAMKYTARGHIYVHAWMNAGKVHISVRDTGAGIPAERLDDIFKPFLQLDPHRDGGRGSGLGLSIVRLLAERMGGSVRVESAPGTGTTFEVTLPLLEATLDDPTDTEVTLAPPRIRLKVLVADDNQLNQMVLRALLESIGHTVIVANDGHEVLDRLRTFDADLVLMDVQMPRLDGLEATRRIRKDVRLKRLPVLALTAGALPSEHAQCVHAGMNGMVVKPVTRESLQRSLDAITKDLD